MIRPHDARQVNGGRLIAAPTKNLKDLAQGQKG